MKGFEGAGAAFPDTRRVFAPDEEGLCEIIESLRGLGRVFHILQPIEDPEKFFGMIADRLEIAVYPSAKREAAP